MRCHKVNYAVATVCRACSSKRGEFHRFIVMVRISKVSRVSRVMVSVQGLRLGLPSVL